MATDAPHITPTELGLDPQDAWQPIDAAAWTPDAIKHFLRRSGWAALPEQVESASQKGLESTLLKHFPKMGTLMPEPVLTTYLAQDSVELQRKARQEPDPDAKREYQRQLRERNNSALDDQAIRWLMFASDPSHSAVEKWVLFLSDVYVVAIEKVRNSSFIFTHFDAIRKNCLGAAPALSKSMLRSPALVTYLDLQQNKPQAPNENFARELFELFVLGEGNYSEDDIKEAARALTGYRINGERVQFQSKQHDKSPKTIFGQTGDYDGEGLIDLAYTQKAASTFLPREMVRYYLSEIPLDPAYIDALGEYWAGTRHDLQALTHRFFLQSHFLSSAIPRRPDQIPRPFLPRFASGSAAGRSPIPAQNAFAAAQHGTTAL